MQFTNSDFHADSNFRRKLRFYFETEMQGIQSDEFLAPNFTS